jgi:adhesin/invasin
MSINRRLISLALTFTGWLGAQHPADRRSAEAIGLPLVFEPNLGQTLPRVRFLAHAAGMTSFLTNGENVVVLRRNKDTEQTVIRVSLIGAKPPDTFEGMEQAESISNYFIGNARSKWVTDVPNYRKVRASGIYPGVDLVYYGDGQELEYDFVVRAGANPRKIRLAFEGAVDLNTDAEGNLLIGTNLGTIVQRKPKVYQEINGKRTEIAASYSILAGKVGFAIARFDHRRDLVIDPVLQYSTYLGGTGGDSGRAIAINPGGEAYITGYTTSTDFPITSGAYQTTAGSQVAFVTRLNAAGSSLVYSTYLGGTKGDQAYGIAIDSSGAAYIAGYTASNDFPTTPGSYQPTSGGASDAFVTKLNAAGNTLVYSTYLGANSKPSVQAIAVDANGSAYVTGYVGNNFPTTPGAFQPSSGGGVSDGFVTKLTADGSALVYSTYLGGKNNDDGYGIAVDSGGAAYVTGYTQSSNFPTTAGAFQTNLPGSQCAFVTKLSADGSALVYSTYLGGNNNDGGYAIAVDSNGAAYVAGSTQSNNFPTTTGAYQNALPGSQSAFVTKLSTDGSALAYSTYLGGSNSDQASAIALDSSGNAYVSGYTSSSDFPTAAGAYQITFAGGSHDVFVSELNATGTALTYSTYLGGSGDDQGYGIAVDSSGAIYVTGSTTSADFPTTPGAFQPAPSGSINSTPEAFVTKLVRPGPPAVVVAESGTPQSTIVGTAFGAALVTKVTDAGGNPLAGVTVTFVAPGTGASAMPSATTATTDGSGRASVMATANTSVGVYSITATVSGVGTAIFNLTNLAGPAQTIVFAQHPSNAAAGNAISPAVTVALSDSYSNPIANASVRMSLQEAGTLQGTLMQTTGANGIAAFGDLKITKAGTYHLNAAGGSLTAVSNAFVISAATTTIVISAYDGDGQSAPVGGVYASPLKALVQDAYLNPIQGASVTFTAPGTGPSVAFGGSPTVIADANGLATSPAMTAKGVLGSFQVTASAVGASAPTAFNLTNLAATAEKLSFIQQPKDTAAGVSITPPVTVQLEDSFGNAVHTAGVAVALELNPVAVARLPGLRSFAAQTTDSNGLATFASLSITQVGQYQLLAESAGVDSAGSNTFNIHAGTASTIRATGGTPQTATVLTPFVQGLQATVSDASGNPVSGATVSFAAPGSGASAVLNASSAITDANGHAVVNATANNVAGSYVVSASTPGVAGNANFALTNVEGTVEQLTFVQQPNNTIAGAIITPAVVVLVLDQGGHPAGGAMVTVHLQGGTASLNGTLTMASDPSGHATFNDLSITTAGTYQMVATSASVAAVSNAVVVGAATTGIIISVYDGDGQSAAVGGAYALPLKAHVQDAFLNPIRGASVTFTAPGSGPSITFSSSSTVTTDANGIATSPAMTANGVLGSFQVIASTTGAAAPAAFNLTNLAATAEKLAFVQQPTDAAAGVNITPPVTVQLEDSFGNAVHTAGVIIALQLDPVAVSRLPGLRSFASQTTDSNGLATFASLSVTQVGQYQLLAESAGIDSVTSNTFNIHTGTASTIRATGGTPQNASVLSPFAQGLQATVSDASGNLVSGATVSFAVPGSGASATLDTSSAITDANGHAVVNATANNAPGSYVVGATTPGVPGSANFSLTNEAAALAVIAEITYLQQPNNTTAGAIISPPVVVLAVDQGGRPVSGATITLHLQGGAASLNGTVTATTDANGRSAFNDLSITTAGTYQMVAVSGSVSAVSNAFVVSASTIAIVISVYDGDGQSAPVGGAYAGPLKAMVQDAFLNPIQGASVTFSAPGTGPSVSFSGSPAVTTDPSGVAVSPNMVANSQTGSFEVTASTSGAMAPTIFSLTNLAANADRLVFVQQPTNTIAGASMTPAVTVQLEDALGNAVHTAGVPISLKANAVVQRLHQLSGIMTQNTDTNGLATFSGLSIISAGTYQFEAEAAGISSATSNTFQITAASPAVIQATGGTPQNAIVNTPFAAPLQVTVTDSLGNPINGVQVTFSAPSSGASGSIGGQSITIATTDAQGRASVFIIANGIPGTYGVIASAASVTGSAQFILTNLAGGGSALVFIQQPTNTQAGRSISPPVTVQVRSGSGGAAGTSGVPVTVSLLSGSGTLFGTVLQVTDSTGTATFSDLKIAQAGAKQLQASSTGQAPAASAVFQITPGAAGRVTVYSGSPQSTQVSQPFPSPLRARVTDLFGNPVSGAQVTFDLPASPGPGGMFSGSPNVVTDANGLATAPTLTANNQTGTFVVTAATDGVSSPAMFTLINLPSQSTDLGINPRLLTFASEINQPAPPTQTAQITASDTTNWTITTSASWLAAMPANETGSGQIAVSVNPAGLAVGNYSGSVRITDSGGGVAVVLVSYTIASQPALVITPPALTFNTTNNSIIPSMQMLQATSSSRTIAYGVAGQVSTPPGGAWLQVTPLNGQTGETVTVSVNPSGLDQGIYSGSVLYTPTDPALNSVAVPVTLIVGCQQGGCTVQPDVIATVNGASFHPGGSPGAIVTIFGTNLSDAVYGVQSYPLPTALGPTSVTANGITVPLYYVSPTQINFQMPSGVPAGGVSVVVSNGAETGQYSAKDSSPHISTLTDVQPGLFVTSGNRADALNADLTPHTALTPIAAGGSVILFLTGQGSVTPAIPDGAPAPAVPLSIIGAPVQVFVGGQSAQVTFQGLAPGFAGLAQINAIVPSGLTSGDQLVFVTINGVPSNAGLITVQ